jgi:hypothetical protein
VLPVAIVVDGIEYTEGIGTFVGCGRCGCVVHDAHGHAQFHRGNDADAVVAAVRVNAGEQVRSGRRGA